MLGAGVFTALAPAAAAAGPLLPAAVGLAGLLAALNATSTARLAARHPSSGGAYVYGTRQLGPLWGYLAGAAFVAGKTASCAAVALTVGRYAWPEHPVPVAAAAVVALAVLDSRGIRKGVALSGVVVAVVLVTLAALVAVAAVAVAEGRVEPPTGTPDGGGPHGLRGLLAGAGFCFFAFAGYARVATVGEEVRDPARTVPRAVGLSLAVVLVVYVAVALAALAVLGVGGLASATAPLAGVVEAAGAPALAPAVRAAAAVAAVGSLLALLLGVSRTTMAMARDGHLPAALARTDPGTGVPARAVGVVAALVVLVVATVDVTAAIGASSVLVLAYYAVAGVSAWTLGGGPAARTAAAAGVVLCVAVAAALPPSSVLAGLVVLALAAALFAVRRPLSGAAR